MKNYFPFTDYDFYAYLTSGVLALSVVDYSFNNASLLMRSDWSFVQIVAAVALAYVTGHIMAMLSHPLLETFVVNKVIAKPIRLQLGLKNPNWFERFIGLLVGRYYEPMPEGTRESILSAARESLGRAADAPIDAEEVFQQGFRKTFSLESVRTRLDDFRNQYGFCRNIAFVALASGILIVWRVHEINLPHVDLVIIGSFALFFGMLVRFVKFLASFQYEVVRTLLK